MIYECLRLREYTDYLRVIQDFNSEAGAKIHYTILGRLLTAATFFSSLALVYLWI